MKYQILVFLALLFGFATAEAATVTASVTANVLALDKPGPITLTWTAQGASKCTAGGDWSGSKVVTGGSETVQITKTSTFSLACESPTGPATLTWTNPTAYSDNSSLVVKDIQVMSGPSPTTLARLTVVPPTPSSNVVVQAPPGLTYFTVRARDAAGLESVDSTPVSKSVVVDKATPSITVTLAVRPNPPTNFTVE